MRLLAALCLGLMLVAAPARVDAAASRIKDIVDIEGVRDNMLVGYGLVVGLNGTGDGLNNAPFTRQSLIAMLERLGVNIRGENLNSKNVAAVMVTATLPPFTNQGAKIDVNVSAFGDAKSLQGGTLLVTPMMGADGAVYAIAQGPIAIGGFSAAGAAEQVTQNTPTAGRIASGAIVEREVGYDFASQSTVRLALRNPDFTTARRVADAINQQLGAGIATAENSSSVRIASIDTGKNVVDVIGEIENLTVEPDQLARVVIDERSGTIVMGKDVRVSTVAIAQGNLTVKVTEAPQVSQPGAFSQTGDTIVVPRSQVQVATGEDRQIALFDSGVSLQELVTNLNALGISPRDVITILQAIKAAGALQAEIEVM